MLGGLGTGGGSARGASSRGFRQEEDGAGATGRIRVLLCDDHPMIVESLAARLGEEADIEVVGCANEGARALELEEKLRPDVFVLDLGFETGMSGQEILEMRNRGAASGAGVLILSGDASRSGVRAAFDEGARGYVLKGSDFEELVRGIRALARGKEYFVPEVVGALRERPGAGGTAGPDEGQRKVLRLVGEGLTDIEIARSMHTSKSDVRRTLKDVWARKLGLEGKVKRAVLIRRAAELGWI